jgi:predicted phage terminase large subunit-like protein
LSRLAKEIIVDAAKRALAPQSLLYFIKYTKPDYNDSWHHRAICKELDAMITGETTRLMLFAPPRHGKSEIASRRFPAYLFGKDPDAEVIACSYTSDLAQRMNRDVQRIIDTPRYRLIFPHVTLWGKNIRTTAQGSYLRNSDIFEIVGHSGSYRSAGVGGAITGMGAKYCVPTGTMIETPDGEKEISYLTKQKLPLILTFNHLLGTIDIEPVVASKRSVKNEFVTITTESGIEFTCTTEHRVYVEEKGYIEAKRIQAGDDIKELHRTNMCPLRNTIPSVCLCKKQADTARNHKNILLERMLKSCKKPRTVCLAPLSGVWGGIAQRRNLLLGRLQKKAYRATRRREQGKPENTMPDMRGNVSARKQQEQILLDGLQKQGALRAHENQESELQARTGIQIGIQGKAWRNKIKGRASLSTLRNGERKSYSPSQRQKSAKQHRRKSYNALQRVSRNHTQNARVARIEFSTGERIVYDIQTNVNHNFFANGILVHNCIIDDPVKNREDANSEAMRKKLWEWYVSTLYTRLSPDGRILLILTRWHELDLAGQIIEQMKAEDGEQWRVVSFPAFAEPGRDDAHESDDRREGAALWPDRYNAKRLSTIKRVVGAYEWAALFQQRPSPSEGAIFLREWWKYYDESPGIMASRMDEIIQSWDMTFKDNTGNDFVVGQTWGKKGADRFLLDQARARMDFPATVKAVCAMKSKWPQANRIYVEDKANGPAVISILQREIQGLIPVNPEGGKVVRANAVTGQIESGNVYLPTPQRVSWIGDFIEECAAFPNGAHDDQVDAMSQALIHMVEDDAIEVWRKLGMSE